MNGKKKSILLTFSFVISNYSDITFSPLTRQANDNVFQSYSLSCYRLPCFIQIQFFIKWLSLCTTSIQTDLSFAIPSPNLLHSFQNLPVLLMSISLSSLSQSDFFFSFPIHFFLPNFLNSFTRSSSFSPTLLFIDQLLARSIHCFLP